MLGWRMQSCFVGAGTMVLLGYSEFGSGSCGMTCLHWLWGWGMWVCFIEGLQWDWGWGLWCRFVGGGDYWGRDCILDLLGVGGCILWFFYF